MPGLEHGGDRLEHPVRRDRRRYFLYGKRQHEGVPMICGFALMVFPYFVSSAWRCSPSARS